MSKYHKVDTWRQASIQKMNFKLMQKPVDQLTPEELARKERLEARIKGKSADETYQNIKKQLEENKLIDPDMQEKILQNVILHNETISSKDDHDSDLAQETSKINDKKE